MSGRSDRLVSARSSRASSASENVRETTDDLIVTGTPASKDDGSAVDERQSGTSRPSTARSRRSNGSEVSVRSRAGSARSSVAGVEKKSSDVKDKAGSARSSKAGSARSGIQESTLKLETGSAREEVQGSAAGKDTESARSSAENKKQDSASSPGSSKASSRVENSITSQASYRREETSARDHSDISEGSMRKSRRDVVSREQKSSDGDIISSAAELQEARAKEREQSVESARERRSEDPSPEGQRSGSTRGWRDSRADRPPTLQSENTGDLYHIDDGGMDLEDSDYSDADIPSNAASDGREDDVDDDVAEVVVLDPEHKLMERFQARLTEHLEQQSYKYTLEVRELRERVRERRKEREDVGVELYGLQQELAKYQMMLEKLHDDHSSAQQGRQETERRLSDTRAAQQSKLKLLEETRRAAAELQAEVELTNQRLFFLSANKAKNNDEIAVIRRAAEKSKNENKKLEVEKRMQDLYVDRLVERLDRVRQDIAMYDAQITAQAQETSEAREALSEANMEIELLHVEKRQLLQKWSSSVVGMNRRDEAHAALVSALSDSQQRLQTLTTELNAFKKSTQQEQELNEKLMSTLNKIESDVESVRRQLAASRSEHESLKQEFSTLTRILTETEDCFRSVNREKGQYLGQLEQLKHDVEKQYLEKVRLEDAILDKNQDKLTAVKGSQYTQKLIRKLRDRTRELETQLVVAENDIAKIMLSTAHLESRIDGQNKVKRELEAEVKKFDESIARTQCEISKREMVIERKQNSLDILSKRLSSMVENAGGLEAAPLELTIKSLQKSIEEENRAVTELQQAWLREQAALVELCGEQEARSSEVEGIKQQISVLTQRRLRLEREVETEKREAGEIQRHIQAMHTDRVKLDTLVQRERGSETTLRDDNILAENRYIGDLRAAERASIELEGRLEALKEEKARLVNSLVEAERQIMMWERKTELAKETHAAIDADVGHGEVYQMKTEIHRMQVRLNQLTKQQERLIVEMERSVSYRDTIAARGEAATKSGAKGGKGASQTRNVHQRAVAALQRSIKQKSAEMSACDSEYTQLRERQREVTEEIDRRQSNMRGVAETNETTGAELDEMIDSKGRGLLELVANQKRAKHYEQLREGRYKRACSGSRAEIDTELRKQGDKMHMVTAIVERLADEYPRVEEDLKRVLSVYGSKINEVQLA